MRRALIVGVLICAVAGLVAAQSSLVLWGSRLRYIFLDRFNTDADAPLSAPRACEPGPGSWKTLTDSTNKISITSQELNFSGGLSVLGDPAIWSTAITTTGGTALLFDALANSNASFWIGWDTNTLGAPVDAIVFSGATTINKFYVSSDTSVFAPFPIVHPMSWGMIRRASAGVFFVSRVPGEAWKLRWVAAVGSNGTRYVSLQSWKNPARYDNVRVVNLPGWTTDAQIYTSYMASPANPTSAAATADLLAEVIWTPVAGETLELWIRRSDAQNGWIHRCSESSSTMKIIEVVSGVETERASTAVTWTPATPVRIVVTADDTEIRQYSGTAPRNTYSSASSNKTVGGVYLSGHTTASNLYCWPRYVPIPGGV